MRISKDDIPVKVDAPGAQGRQQPDFGDVAGYGAMGAEYFSLGAGADMAPLLAGLEHDLCHSPHWGYVIEGELTVTYKDGSTETTCTGDMFYWPPFHTIRAEKDTEFVLFSPQHEHGAVMDHVSKKLGG
jgi:hypothetical protein